MSERPLERNYTRNSRVCFVVTLFFPPLIPPYKAAPKRGVRACVSERATVVSDSEFTH